MINPDRQTDRQNYYYYDNIKNNKLGTYEII